MPIAALGAAAIGAAGSIASSKSANDSNQRAYRTRYQTQVKDLKKAGLNPMLAFQNGAPVAPAAQAPNLGESIDAGARVYQARTANQVANAQVKNLEADTDLKGTASAVNIAQARESSIRSSIAEESVPYAAGSARENYYILASTRTRVANEVEQISENIKITEQNYRHLEQLQPLLREYQRLQNAVARAELPAKEAEAAFWEALPEAAWVKQLRAVLPSFPVRSLRGPRK